MRGPFALHIALAGFAAAAPVDIPFRLTRGMIVVDATIQGSDRPMRFIVDSGAGETILAKRTAAELSLDQTDGERIQTVLGTENVTRASSISIKLGTSSRSFRFSPRPLVLDLATESRTLGSRIDGLLGIDFFHGRSIKIDFAKSTIHVAPDGKPGPNATRLPLLSDRGAIFVGLTAATSHLRRVRLDTGCCRSLCWSPPDGSLVKGFWRDGETMKIDVNLGSLAMNDVPSDIYRRPLFAGEDGLLGTALLSRFDAVWIDSVNHRVSFETVGD